MFKWLKKGNNSCKTLRHSATDDVYKILCLFAKVNNITIYEIDDILKKLELNYPYASILDKKSIAIADDIWKEDGYIGSIQFDKEIFDDYNSSNKYAKSIYNEAQRHVVLNHVIHLCKDGIILEFNYKYFGFVMGDETKTCRRIYFKLNKKDNDYQFTKTKEHVSIGGSYGSCVIKNNKGYTREQLSDNIIRLSFINNDGRNQEKLVIEIYKDKDQMIDFVNEKILVSDIWYSNFNLPSVALKYMIDYFEKNNIDISFIKVMKIVNGWKVAKDLVYENYSEVNSKKVSLLEKKVSSGDIDVKCKPTLKTINIYNTVEGDKNVRVLEVDSKNAAKMILKVYMNNTDAFIPNETKLINYLLKEFPELSLTGNPNFGKLDVLFHNISTISFSNIDDNLSKVELFLYKGDYLMGTKEWKKHIFEESCPVLRKKY